MDVVTMGIEKSRAYSIRVERTVRQVVDLLTRKREFALVSACGRISSTKKLSLEAKGYEWIELCDVGKEAEANRSEIRYLVIGGCLNSREDVLRPDYQGASEFACLKGCDLAFLSIDGLYGICEGRSLKYSLAACSENEANEYWLQRMLRLGEDPGKWYASDDFSSITVSMRRVVEGSASEAAGSEADCGEREAVDVAGFEVYDRLCGKLEQMARSCWYGDDIFVEYSISSNGGCARYCATEFYSNHNWNADPANLLVVRFGAEVSSEKCSARDVQFSHPTKTTERKSNHERFLIDSLAMANDIETKFSSGRGEDRHPNESVSADRVMDNLVDFDMWVEMHRKEIELL